MVEALVVHNTLNSVGGGERVSLAVIETLKELGYEATLLTTEPTDWGKVRKIIGDYVKPDNELTVLPFRLRYFGIYMRLLTFIKMIKAKKRYALTINTHGDVLPVDTDIIYMHYPTFTLLRENPVNIKYGKSLFWRAYFKPYEVIQSRLAKRIRNSYVVTNSEFSKEAIRKYLGVEAKVIHPPVSITEFLKASNNNNGREDTVVSCGRYSPEKNYEFLIDVAQQLPKIKFMVIGASSGKVSKTYLSKLRNKINLTKTSNVELRTNVPMEEQVRTYSRAKAYLHNMINEHFGIAVVEAMASGLIPIVHKSGGAWLDIIDRGRYGYGYTNLEEAVESIKKAVSEGSKLRNKVIGRAKQFSKEKFKKEFTRVIDEVMSGEREWGRKESPRESKGEGGN